MSGLSSRASFTLIELLVVVAIVTILAVVVVLTLNPAQLLKQARDSTRVSDLATLNQALSFFQTDVVGGSMGATSSVSVSIADSSATCANLGLPALPSGYTYRCVTSANLKKVDGSGWIPVNFTSISTGSPLPTLPIDPTNSTSTGTYYAFLPGGSWELTALFESNKFADRSATDRGVDLAMYEVGSSVTLSPFAHGLVGYWTFDESSGTLADSSGFGNSGTQNGGVTYGVSGKVGTALSFDGVDDYVSVGQITMDATTWVLWFKTSTANQNGSFISNFNGTAFNRPVLELSSGTLRAGHFGSGPDFNNIGTPSTGAWHQVAMVHSASSVRVYLDGIDQGSVSGSYSSGTAVTLDFGRRSVGDYQYNGSMDDIRIYNRALSAAEIKAIYDATK